MNGFPVTDDIKAWRAVLKTDAGGAAIAQLWYDGVPQKTLAKAFRYVGPAPITSAIFKFMFKYARDYMYDKTHSSRWSYKTGEDRKALVPYTIHCYKSRLNQPPPRENFPFAARTSATPQEHT